MKVAANELMKRKDDWTAERSRWLRYWSQKLAGVKMKAQQEQQVRKDNATADKSAV